MPWLCAPAVRVAQRSVQLLVRYRQGLVFDAATCPLARALAPHQEKARHPGAAQMALGL